MSFSPELIRRIRAARRVAVLTGAGISAESGVPTFRGPQGLWKKFRPEQLANEAAFRQDPGLVWEWYRWRRGLIRSVPPNPGHFALARMEALFPSFVLVTQNVDGLHARAGSRRLLELHGNILSTHCLECRAPATDAPEEGLPRCACGGLLRPGVVWFGESLPEKALHEAARAAGECELFLSVGTSGAVYPAASLPLLARQAGAFVVEINPERTELSDEVDEIVLAKAGECLPALAALCESAD